MSPPKWSIAHFSYQVPNTGNTFHMIPGPNARQTKACQNSLLAFGQFWILPVVFFALNSISILENRLQSVKSSAGLTLSIPCS